MDVGDHVYHKGCNGNGIIVERDDTKRRDIWRVEFLWGTYVDAPHIDENGKKYVFASSDSLVELERPDQINRVSMLGSRSLDRLLQRMCGIPRRRSEDGSDIVINYGKNKHRVSSRVFMINRHLIWNKYEQCQRLGDIAPESISVGNFARDPDEWIIKPYKSIGGYGIHTPRRGQLIDIHSQYMQRNIHKTREFRAHVFRWLPDPVLLIQEKTCPDPDQLCWNKKQGGVFSYPYEPLLGRMRLEREETELFDRICDIAVEACHRLNYDMGGVDIGLSRDNQLFVFEVNSRMGIKEQSLCVYKYAFWQLFDLDINHYQRERQ